MSVNSPAFHSRWSVAVHSHLRQQFAVNRCFILDRQNPMPSILACNLQREHTSLWMSNGGGIAPAFCPLALHPCCSCMLISH